MKLVDQMRRWWQEQTGEEVTPFDGDSMAFVSSLCFHLCLLLALGLIPLAFQDNRITLSVVAPSLEEEETEPELELPEDFYFDEQPSEKIGANSINGVEMAMSIAPVISEVSDVPNLSEIDPTNTQRQIEINEVIQVATGLNYSKNLAIKGAAGQGTTGAMGAVDRITHEILLSLEERKTLVVWLFDQSGSLNRQRAAIYKRFDRIYEELGVIEAAGNEAFSKHSDKPLLTSVVGFGDRVQLMTPKPTDNLAEIKQAVADIQQDASGVERAFSAVYMSADKYKGFRMPNSETGEPERNVMIVVFTDEKGDDQQGLEETIKICRRYEMPVYVVGVPAPFGREKTMVKWVDPDPNFDQSPRWGEVSQGPESYLPERIKIHFDAKEEEKPIDSGFGPFALTRMSYETGGIYFAVHPNRNVTRNVSGREVEAFSAHLERFFDPAVMRRYRPAYVSPDEYKRRVSLNNARLSLIRAAQRSWLTQMQSPQTEFVKRSEAEFANDLSEAQREAAKLEPKVLAIYEDLKVGESDRDKEATLRWQAGFDLAMGRVLAVKVRTEGYNAMLAKAKRGMKFQDPKNNTWTLRPADELDVGSQFEKAAQKAKDYLERVIKEHAETPWALLAQRELERPVGWKWEESFTDLSPPPNRVAGNNNNNNPANDQRRMLKPPPPKRAVPKL